MGTKVEKSGKLVSHAGGAGHRHLETWRILFTDYRRPLKTFISSFRAAIGLYFFKEGFAKASLTN